MGVMDKFLDAMRLNVPYDEELDEDEEYSDEEEEEKESGRHSSRFSKKSEDYDMAMSDPEEGSSRERERSGRHSSRSANHLTTVSGSRSGSRYEVCMIVSRSADDLDQIADLLIDGKAVVLNLEGVSISDAQRIIDFTCGCCYTMGGRLQRISSKIFIATPNYIELSGDFIDMLNENMDMNALNLSM